MKKAYKRIMLKFSGEVLRGKEDAIDFKVLEDLCKEIKVIHRKKVQMAIVVGGGNIWRYRDNKTKHCLLHLWNKIYYNSILF